MATSCRIGALTGERPRDEVDALTDFGSYFGMIFQVRDDILDIIGSEDELGKPPGQDLAEGIYTLPVLFALADPDAGPELRPLLGQPLGQPERDKARSIVAASSGIASSVAVGRRYADQAATAAAARCPSAGLADGFERLAYSLLDGLPDRADRVPAGSTWLLQPGWRSRSRSPGAQLPDGALTLQVVSIFWLLVSRCCLKVVLS